MMREWRDFTEVLAIAGVLVLLVGLNIVAANLHIIPLVEARTGKTIPAKQRIPIATILGIIGAAIEALFYFILESL